MTKDNGKCSWPNIPVKGIGTTETETEGKMNAEYH